MRSNLICEQLGDIHGYSRAQWGIGIAYEAQGHYDRALKCLEEALRLLRQIGSYEAAQIEQLVERVRGKVG